MEIAALQRELLRLFKASDGLDADNDAYIGIVARSRDLQEARNNILMWRVWVLERACPLTVALLRQRNVLEENVRLFIAHHNISPFRETQGPVFLAYVSAHEDSLIASVAQFELALIKVKSGVPADHVVVWNVEPSGILNSLATGAPFDENAPRGRYETRLSRSLPMWFEIVALDN